MQINSRQEITDVRWKQPQRGTKQIVTATNQPETQTKRHKTTPQRINTNNIVDLYLGLGHIFSLSPHSCELFGDTKSCYLLIVINIYWVSLKTLNKQRRAYYCWGPGLWIWIITRFKLSHCAPSLLNKPVLNQGSSIPIKLLSIIILSESKSLTPEEKNPQTLQQLQPCSLHRQKQGNSHH